MSRSVSTVETFFTSIGRFSLTIPQYLTGDRHLSVTDLETNIFPDLRHEF